MEILDGPRVVELPERPTLGIRVVTPFRGMLRVRDELLGELHAWLDRTGAAVAGPPFLRLHVIDMDGPMDLEVGVLAPGPAGDDRVRPGALSAGRYATLTYRDHAGRANRTLLEWVAEHGLPLDRRDTPAGDAFACRYEAYLTDPRAEPRKTRWEIALAIRLADAP